MSTMESRFTAAELCRMALAVIATTAVDQWDEMCQPNPEQWAIRDLCHAAVSLNEAIPAKVPGAYQQFWRPNEITVEELTHAAIDALTT